MDNPDTSNPAKGNPDEPVSSSDDADGTSISHSPLNLGGPAAAEVPKVKTTARPAKPVELKQVEQRPVEKTAPSERITGVKTFFAKLHAGAIQFLDEQITKWLKDNPDISIKLTNMVTGEIQGKKTEPNIIITVWY
jgi:hypothetical protein